MSKYVPRPGTDERRIVRRANVTKDVSRSRPRSFVRRGGARTVGSAERVRRRGSTASAGRARRAGFLLRRLATGPVPITLVVLIALAAGSVWLWRSSVFEVRHVEIVGASTIPVAQIAEAASLEGEHMVTADLGAAQRAVRDLPLVRSVRVERKWPDTIVLTVEERTRWGTWNQVGVDYSIDRDGVVLGASPADPAQPYVVSAEPSSLRQGDPVNYQAVDAAAEIYRLLPRRLGTGVHQVAFFPGEGIQVVTNDGQTAILGDSSSIAYKLAVWAAAADEAARLRINYDTIDLRWGPRPVLR